MQVTIRLKLENGCPGVLSFLPSSLYNYIYVINMLLFDIYNKIWNNMEIFDNKNGKMYHITVPI